MARKAAAKAYETQNVSADHPSLLETRSALLDKRVVEGYAVIWGSKNLHDEVFHRGAFSKAINDMGVESSSEFKIKFAMEHGEVICLFAELKEDDIGLYFRTVPLPMGETEDKILRKLKDKTYNNFSIGFRYVWDKMSYDEVARTINIYEAFLMEISVVGLPSDLNSYAIRSVEQMANLYDDTEDFILSLPRKFQNEARSMFSIYKALFIDKQPELENRSALDKNNEQPEEKEIDFAYICERLTKNF